MNTTFHRDGTVTLWDVYNQVWLYHVSAKELSGCDRILSTLSDKERNRISRIARQK